MDKLIDTGGSTARLEELRESAGAPVLKLIGEVDLSSVELLRVAIEPFAELNPDRIAFDLSELSFMDSAGLAMLLGVAEQADAVELRNPLPMILKIPRSDRAVKQVSDHLLSIESISMPFLRVRSGPVCSDVQG